MYSTILNITFDCTDARAQAMFWAAAELARLVGLGVTVLADQPPDVNWIILADPEGNEFCLEG
jgi:hypothetical protein